LHDFGGIVDLGRGDIPSTVLNCWALSSDFRRDTRQISPLSNHGDFSQRARPVGRIQPAFRTDPAAMHFLSFPEMMPTLW
jgi:hypothetical protein